jgi:hypothetical protein
LWTRSVVGETEAVAEEFLKGRLHVSMLWFAEMRGFTHEVAIPFKTHSMVVRLKQTDSSESRTFPHFFKEFLALRAAQTP